MKFCLPSVVRQVFSGAVISIAIIIDSCSTRRFIGVGAWKSSVVVHQNISRNHMQLYPRVLDIYISPINSTYLTLLKSLEKAKRTHKPTINVK